MLLNAAAYDDSISYAFVIKQPDVKNQSPTVADPRVAFAGASLPMETFSRRAMAPKLRGLELVKRVGAGPVE